MKDVWQAERRLRRRGAFRRGAWQERAWWWKFVKGVDEKNVAARRSAKVSARSRVQHVQGVQHWCLEMRC